MASFNPLAAETDDEVLRRELEQARKYYQSGKANNFCILCRSKKQVVLSHLIPWSVLNSSEEEIHAINVAGQEVGLRRHGYRGFCRPCEEMLSEKGEQNFNRLMHEPLVRDYNSAVHIEGDEVGKVYHCAISIWWRFATLHSKLACEESSEGKEYRKLLESVRVWLHEPRGSLPLGLQVNFWAFHPDDISHLKRLDVHDAATKVYAGVKGDDGNVRTVQMGPLHCLYTFEARSTTLPQSIHIDKGNDRSLCPPEYKTMLVGYYEKMKEEMWNLEARASNRTRSSSEPPVKVSFPNLIPPGTAVFNDDEVEFPYHRHIHTVICSSKLGDIHIDLYKPKQQEDKPPYQGVAFIFTKGGGRVRVWLKSNCTGSQFSLPEEFSRRCLAEETFQELKELVATLRVKYYVLHDSLY